MRQLASQLLAFVTPYGQQIPRTIFAQNIHKPGATPDCRPASCSI